jgi:hypothetical protein
VKWLLLVTGRPGGSGYVFAGPLTESYAEKFASIPASSN